ncbi:endolytic transglycosylase MltG [Sporosarcina sp. HYO08]|uniref:endolytic transglycosylase MltG n=1 Tax=Sporosarcina sp. HYO08 TaxID=1759557 RepID=UPI000796AF7E|nr:endolytic transglycosylase MltG [Sporosarcina sp. HYO08]KXH87436.1 hypothetical protein AU377_02370 [Sporosarcina sp. HYO08]
MIRDLLRFIGGGCIIAAGILYFADKTQTESAKQNDLLQHQIQELEERLAHANEQLAIAQTVKQAPTRNASTEKNTAKMTLKIKAGDDSTVVAADLVKANIIQNATEFEKYLKVNRLAGKIQIGEYTIDDSMDYETIAKLITSQP